MKKLLFALCIGLGFTANAQQFVNGDFQQVTTGWTNNNTTFANFGINGDAPGNYYVDMTGSSLINGYSIQQQVNIAEKCTYQVSLSLRPGGPSAPSKTAGVRVEMDGNILAPGKFLSNDWSKWLTFTTDAFTATAGNHTFRFIADNNEATTPQVIGLDNIRLEKIGSCSIEEGACCPGKNLVCNGNFDKGQECFESQYAYGNAQPFKPGSFIVTGYEKASQLCKNWSFTNAPCNRNGKAMFINGNTNGQGSKIIWKQTVPFNAWKQYRFCADVYAFNQCCFNVAPKLTMTLTYQSGGQTKTVSLPAEQADACGWVKFTKYIAQWEGNDGGNATISISLDETGIGDGNDLALDNIALIELAPLPKAVTNSASLTIGAGSANSISASFTGNLSPYGNVAYEWIVVPLDANGQPDPNCPEVDGPAAWWTPTTNFPGFDGCRYNANSNAPGKFLPGKTYKIALGTFGFCYAWDAKIFTVKVDNASQKITITPDTEPNETNPSFKMIKPDNKWLYDRIISGK